LAGPGLDSLPAENVSEQRASHIAVPAFPLPPDEVARREMRAERQNLRYVKAQKLRALLSLGRPKKILFSVKPDWAEYIRFGFKNLPHRIEFGPITQDSFQRFDIVVPLDLDAIDAARRYSAGQNVALPLPSEEAQRLCNDKYELNQTLIQDGFSRYIPKMVQGFGIPFPYIVKKRIGCFGKDCHVIRNARDEQFYRDLITDPEYFSQELIQGVAEFATHILFVKGRIVKALNIKYEFADVTPIKGLSPELFQDVQRCPHLDLFARMLRRIQFEGLCCLNYKQANGQPYLLEVNPRFGGSLSPYFFAFVRYLRRGFWQGRALRQRG